MYQIARYFTLEARRKAAETHYKGIRSEDGCCPLGICLQYDRLSDTDVPSANAVGEAVIRHHPELRTLLPTVVNRAMEFINDWDGDVRVDLYEAFGVER